MNSCMQFYTTNRSQYHMKWQWNVEVQAVVIYYTHREKHCYHDYIVPIIINDGIFSVQS